MRRLALALALSAVAAVAPVSSQEQPLVVSVLVLNFDPRVEAAGGQRLHEFLGQNDPRPLADEYAADVGASSRGFVELRVVEWRDLDAYPPVQGDLPIEENDFLRVAELPMDARIPAWPRTHTDYPRLIEEHRLSEAIDSGEIDEVWLFGAPGFGFSESVSAGPGAFYINGPVYADVAVSRPFAIMGFNYERGVGNMLHDLAHRTEDTMKHAYGGWNHDRVAAESDASWTSPEPRTNWDLFSAAHAHLRYPLEVGDGEGPRYGQTAGAGNCHWPPNAERAYDYGNFREVLSSADDWLNYPRLTGEVSLVSARTWDGPQYQGSTDYQRGYMRWWFSHLPAAPGDGSDGRLDNWWKYIFGFNLTGGLGKRS